MSLKDLLDLLEKLESRVNTYWNFYSVAVFAVAGWLITSKGGDLKPPQTLPICIGLLAFFIANLSVIHYAEARILAASIEIRSRQSEIDTMSSSLFKDHLRTLAIPARGTFSKCLHGIIDVSLMALILLNTNAKSG